MGNLPIAAQLYTLRDIMPKDVAGTLAAVRELGYDGVEFAGLHNTPARELPEQLRGDWAGLAATLNRLAGPVAAAGMRLAYHNHDFELREQNGKTGLDI